MNKYCTFLYRVVLAVTLASTPVAQAMEERQIVSIPSDMSIPTDVLSQIFTSLPIEDIARYREVHSIFNRLLSDAGLIKKILEKIGIDNPNSDMFYDAIKQNNANIVWLLTQLSDSDCNIRLVNFGQRQLDELTGNFIPSENEEENNNLYREDKTPLLLAAEESNTRILKLLIHQPRVNRYVTNNNGNNALHIVAQKISQLNRETRKALKNYKILSRNIDPQTHNQQTDESAYDMCFPKRNKLYPAIIAHTVIFSSMLFTFFQNERTIRGAIDAFKNETHMATNDIARKEIFRGRVDSREIIIFGIIAISFFQLLFL